jgi:hypothetical protein
MPPAPATRPETILGQELMLRSADIDAPSALTIGGAFDPLQLFVLPLVLTTRRAFLRVDLAVLIG